MYHQHLLCVSSTICSLTIYVCLTLTTGKTKKINSYNLAVLNNLNLLAAGPACKYNQSADHFIHLLHRLQSLSGKVKASTPQEDEYEER